MRQVTNRICANLLKAVMLVALLSALPLAVSAQSGAPTPEYRKGELIVELQPNVSIDAIHARWGTTTIQQLYGTNIYKLRTPKGKKENKWRKRLAKDADILSVALNPLVLNPITAYARSQIGFPEGRPTPAQNPDSYASQQLFAQLQLADVQLRATGKGVVVAVIDTGVDKTHTRIAARLWSDKRQLAEIQSNSLDDDNDGLIDDSGGWDFVDYDNDPAEPSGADPQNNVIGHGTFIAGLITLVAPDATILPLRAFDAEGLSDAFTVATAIKYAADHGAHIINLSFGSIEDSETLRDAVTYARQRGCVLVAAIGNENDDTDARPRYPAAWQAETIAVAALDGGDRKAPFSNFGAAVSVSAPGVQLVSAFPDGEYAMWSGTSFAAPLVAAEAALIFERHAQADARAIIEETAAAIDSVNQSFVGKLGKGRINPLAAVRRFDPAASSYREIHLVASGVEPAARGEAETEITGTEQKFEVEGFSLTPRTSYRIFVDGNLVSDASARFTTNALGGMKIEFSTRASSSHLPLPAALTPVSNIRRVEIRDAADRIVLQGDFQSGGGGTGGGASQFFEKEINLASTGVIAGAQGEAKVESEPQREEVRVEGDHLVSGATYHVIVDGVQLVSVTAQAGYFRVEATSDGSSGLLLPGALRPVGNVRHVEVRDAVGQVVLQGDFSADGGTGGGGGGGEFRFTAVVESLPSGTLLGEWRVGGRTVHVSGATEIRQDDGAVGIGVIVEVRGALQADGSVSATRIEVESSDGDDSGGDDSGVSTDFEARIESLPSEGLIGEWRVGGRTVIVSAATEIRDDDGEIAVGVRVEVRGSRRADNRVNATRIRVRD